MSYVKVEGGNRIKGEVKLQGSKNAALPILAACVLCRGLVRVENCPEITDVRELMRALSYAGVHCRLEQGTLEVDASFSTPFVFGQEMAGKTRGSVLFLGAFLGRFHEAAMAYPGGCVIGARPIDLHCKVLRTLHVTVSEKEEGVFAKGKPKGGRIVLTYPSVGATENALLAAVCAEGRTELMGAATEPEIVELCFFLKKAGAKIYGVGTSKLVIDGVSELHGVRYRLSGDRIAAGTYLVAAAITGGELVLRETNGVCMKGITESLRAAGLTLREESQLLFAQAGARVLPVARLETAPFPAFPTDMQSPMAALLCRAKGESRICETVFESRFGVVAELQKLGADVTTEERCIVIRGGRPLRGGIVNASDLRTGAALLLAGLAAEGETVVYGYPYIARGYEDICGVLRLLGMNVTQIEEH